MLNVSIAEAGYFTGALIEFICEIIATILFTGGTATFATVGREFLAIFEGLFNIIKGIDDSSLKDQKYYPF